MLAGMSAARIAEQLNRDCILSPLAYKKKMGLPYPCNGFADNEKSRWSASTVLRILKDETYTGTLVQGKRYKLNYKIQKQFVRPASEWIRCEKVHEGVVNIFDFEAVQRILLMDTRTPPGDDIVGLFSGLLICGCCGGNMTRKTCKCGDTVYRYYYCPTGKRQGCHAPVMIAEDVLAEAVFKEIRQHVLKAQSLFRQLEPTHDEEIYQFLTKNKLAFIENAQEQLLSIRIFRASLHTSVSKGIISEVECADMDDMYAQEILQLETEIAETIKWMQVMATRVDEYVQQILAIARLAGCDSFDRADIIRLSRRIVVSSKRLCCVEFIVDY